MAANAQSKKENFNPFSGMGMNSFPNFMDANAMREQFNRNMQTFTAANQVAAACAKELTSRAVELMQKNAQYIQECSKDAMSCDTPQKAQSKQSEAVTVVVTNCSSYGKEMADISSKATREILDICNQRMSEALNEFNASK